MILQCPSCDARFRVDEGLIPEAGREVRCAKCAHTWHAIPVAEIPVIDESEDGEKHVAGELTADGSEPAPAPEVENESDEAPQDEPTLEADSTDEDTSEDTDEEESDVEYIDFGESAPAEDMPVFKDEDDEPAEPEPHVLTGLKPAFMAASVLLLITAILAALFAFRLSLQSALDPIYSLMGAQSTNGLVFSNISIRERPARSKKRYVIEGEIINTSEEARTIPTVRAAIHDAEGEVIVSREYVAEGVIEPGQRFEIEAKGLNTAFVDRIDHIVLDMGSKVDLMTREAP